MYPVTGTLILVVADIKFDRSRSPGIHAIDIVIRSDRFYDVGLLLMIAAVPQVDRDRKVTQRPMRFGDVRTWDAARRKDSSYKNQRRHDGSYRQAQFTAAGMRSLVR